MAKSGRLHFYPLLDRLREYNNLTLGIEVVVWKMMVKGGSEVSRELEVYNLALCTEAPEESSRGALMIPLGVLSTGTKARSNQIVKPFGT